MTSDGTVLVQSYSLGHVQPDVGRPAILIALTIISHVAIIVGLSLFPATDAWCTIHYVSNSGSNTYPYDSWAAATDSIKLALDAADPWDTVLVAAGAYTADSLPLKKGVVFSPDPRIRYDWCG